MFKIVVIDEKIVNKIQKWFLVKLLANMNRRKLEPYNDYLQKYTFNVIVILNVKMKNFSFKVKNKIRMSAMTVSI